MLGRGWSDSYHMELYDDGTDVIFADSDGSIYRFVNGVCAESKEMMLHIDTDGSKEVRFKDGTIYSFDTYGRLAYVSELNENTVTNTYDSLGRLSRVTSNAGSVGSRSLEMQYDGDSYLLEEIEDFCGTEYHYSYDSAGRLNEAEVSDGEISGGSVSNEYEYDTSGKMVSVSDRCGNEYGVTYLNGKVYMIENPAGERDILTYTSYSTSVEKQYDEDDVYVTASVESKEYDENTGRVTCETDSDGIETEISYDEEYVYSIAGTSYESEYETVSDGEIEVETYDAENFAEYDSNGKVNAETDEDGTVTEYTYSDEYITREKSSNGTEDISDVMYTYDSRCNLLTETDLIAGYMNRYGYDMCGNEVSSVSLKCIGDNYTETSGYIPVSETLKEYDLQGNETSYTCISGTVTTSIVRTYDTMGKCVTSSENDILTTYEYDYLGRQISVSITDGSETVTNETCYDNNGNVTVESSSSGLEKVYTYDCMCRKLSETAREEGTTGYTSTFSYSIQNSPFAYVESEYNTEGELVSSTYTDGAGRIVKNIEDSRCAEYSFDQAGNVIAEEISSIEESDTAEPVVNAFATDLYGNTICEINGAQEESGIYSGAEDSVITEYEYDLQGNIISEKEGDVLTEYTYDNRGRLTGLDVQEGTSVDIDYIDSGSYVIEEELYEGGSERELVVNVAGLETQSKDIGENGGEICTEKAYDAEGKLKSETYDDDSCMKLIYDSFGRVTQKKYFDEQELLKEITEYEYDLYGNLISVELTDNSTGEICSKTMSYDCFGLVVSETMQYDNDSEYTFGYSYDSEGRTVNVSYPVTSNISGIHYEYDSFGRIAEVYEGNSANGRLILEYEYNGMGNMVSEKRYTGGSDESYVEKICSYDSLGRIESAEYLENGNSLNLIEGFSYTYNNRGYIDSKCHIIGAGENQIHKEYEYEYDNDGRLTESRCTEENSTVTNVYTYDANGNMLSAENGQEESRYEYNRYNQIIEATYSDNAVDYYYDDRGNLITERNYTGDDETDVECEKDYTYDISGNMKSVSVDGIDIQSNIYDENGLRIKRNENGCETSYYYSNGSLTLEQCGSSLRYFVESADGTVAGVYIDDEYYTYVTDIQGSVYNILDENMETVATYEYSDFGEVTEAQGSIENDICYSGAVYDNETGLTYMRARYYNAGIGRFISQDTYRGEDDEPDTWNLYSYCADNPVNFIDFTGHTIWGKQLKLKDYRKIHNRVADLLCFQLNSLDPRREKCVYKKGKKVGFLDVFLYRTYKYYEVKKQNSNASKRTEKQMKKYDGSNIKGNSRKISRGDYSKSIGGTFFYGSYKVSYWYTKKGLVLYKADFIKKRYERYKTCCTIATFAVISIAGYAIAPEAAVIACFA